MYLHSLFAEQFKIKVFHHLRRGKFDAYIFTYIYIPAITNNAIEVSHLTMSGIVKSMTS